MKSIAPIAAVAARTAISALVLLVAPGLAEAEIYDHLVRCDSEVACQSDPTIGRYWHPPDADTPAGSWATEMVLPNVSVYALDPSGNRVPFPGWFAIVSLDHVDAALGTLPNCRLIADREAAARGGPYLRYVAPDITAEQLGAAHVEPTFAGSNYPFGNP